MPLPMTDRQAEEFANKVHFGHDPYEKRFLDGVQNFTKLPHCLHFYYMGIDGAKEDYRHYFHDNGDDPIPYAEVPNLVKKLAKNAVLRDYNPPKHGSNFEDIVWRRRCYIAVVMDTDTFNFWQDKGMRFVDKDSGAPNLSFFDADDFPIQIHKKGGGTVLRTGFFCINHMKRDEIGTDLLETDTVFHSYEFGFKVGSGTRPWFYDPGGTNQGPPETP